MDKNMTMRYDRVADVMYIDQVPVYAEQASDEVEEGIVARTNPTTGEIETLEIMFYTARLAQGKFELPALGALMPA